MVPADEGSTGEDGAWHQPEESAAADAFHGVGDDLPHAQI